MPPSAVETTDVAFAYGDTQAVDGVSTAIPEGSITVLLGPNGAGKTTFVRLVTGTLTPDSGSVRVFGQPPSHQKRERFGVLPQGFTPPERLTPIELLTYYGGLYDEAIEPEVLLDDLGLTEAAHRQYRRLSGGQQRRTCLGIALVNEPSLLVLDEPTTGIDPGGKRDIWGYLPTLAQAGTTILLTTHDMQEAQRLADQIGFFLDGSLLAFGSARELIVDRFGSNRLVIKTAQPEAVASTLDDATVRDDAVVVSDVAVDALPGLIDRLVDTPVDITSIHWERPPLDELFLALTDETEGTTG